MNRTQVESGFHQFNDNSYRHWAGHLSPSEGSLLLRGYSYQGTLMGVSLAGALFAPATKLGKVDGSVCQIGLHDIGGDPEVSLNGVVIHIEDQVLVIKFTALSEKQYSILSHDHALHGSAPELLWRSIAELVKSVSTDETSKSLSPISATVSDAQQSLQRRKFDRRKYHASAGLI